MHRTPRRLSRSARRALALLLAPLLAAGLLAAALITPAHSADSDDKAKKKAIDRSISKLKDDLDETSKSLAVAKAKYDAVHAKLEAARAVVRKAQAEVAAAKQREAAIVDRQVAVRARQLEVQRQLAAVEFKMAQTRDQINALARSAYERGRLSEVAVYLQAESPEDVTMRLAYTQSAVQSEDELLDQLDRERAAVDQRRAELQAAREELLGLRAEAQRLVEARKASARVALAGQSRVAKLVFAANEVKKSLQREANRERNRIEAMERESRAIQAKLAARAATKSGGGYTGQASGTFIRPTGYVTSPFGMRVHPVTGVYKLHDGTDFGGGCGTPIHAIASGRVLEAGYSGAWGNRMVMEHGVINGRSMASAYNHMSGYAVGAGQTIKQGQVVGYIGSTGYSTGCHLHLNLYSNGTPVNPMDYM